MKWEDHRESSNIEDRRSSSNYGSRGRSGNMLALLPIVKMLLGSKIGRIVINWNCLVLQWTQYVLKT